MQTQSSDERAWPAEWLRGALPVCLLHAIAAGPTYGYAIAAAPTDAGLGVVEGPLGMFTTAGAVAAWQTGATQPPLILRSPPHGGAIRRLIHPGRWPGTSLTSLQAALGGSSHRGIIRC